METTYKINIYLSGVQKPLLFRDVKKYSIKDGFVIFRDNVTGKTKHFPRETVTIEENTQTSNNNAFKGDSND